MIERAVINAGPLVALSLLEKLDVLPALFGEFWIPAPVYTEVVTAGLGRPGAVDLSAPGVIQSDASMKWPVQAASFSIPCQ